MHLASLEQQRELMRYINSLNEWLGYGVEVRQTELRGVSARIDQLRDDLHSLDLTGGTCGLHTAYVLAYHLLTSKYTHPQSYSQGLD